MFYVDKQNVCCVKSGLDSVLSVECNAWIENDGHSVVLSVVQTGRAAKAMGGIGHQQAVPSAEAGFADPVFFRHRFPGRVHGRRQGGSPEAAQNGGGYKYV